MWGRGRGVVLMAEENLRGVRRGGEREGRGGKRGAR